MNNGEAIWDTAAAAFYQSVEAAYQSLKADADAGEAEVLAEDVDAEIQRAADSAVNGLTDDEVTAVCLLAASAEERRDLVRKALSRCGELHLSGFLR